MRIRIGSSAVSAVCLMLFFAAPALADDGCPGDCAAASQTCCPEGCAVASQGCPGGCATAQAVCSDGCAAAAKTCCSEGCTSLSHTFAAFAAPHACQAATAHTCQATTTIGDVEQRIEHLQKAAAHLHAAGLTEEADLVRTRAAQEQQTWRRKLLSQKIAQLHALQDEIKKLQSTLDPDSQVLLHVKILDVSLHQLRQHGAHAADLQEFIEAAMTGAGKEKDLAVCVIGENTALLELIESLQSAGAAKMLASPSVVTVNGQRASVAIGGEIAVAAQGSIEGQYESVMHEFGTRLHCTPELSDDGSLRLQFTLKQTDAPLAHAPNFDCAHAAPRVLMDGTVDVKLQPGQNLVICGPHPDAQCNGGCEKSGVLVVICPEIIERVADAEPQIPQAAPSEEDRNQAITRWMLKRWPSPTPQDAFHHHAKIIGPPIEAPAADVHHAEPRLLRRVEAWKKIEEPSHQANGVVSMAENFLDRIWALIDEPAKAPQAYHGGVYIRGVGVAPATFHAEVGNNAGETAAHGGDLQR